MPRGDKSKYTGKQIRKADHIDEGYEARGVSKDESLRRAWATMNAAPSVGLRRQIGSVSPRAAAASASF
jgi:hypothetical protein